MLKTCFAAAALAAVAMAATPAEARFGGFGGHGIRGFHGGVGGIRHAGFMHPGFGPFMMHRPTMMHRPFVHHRFVRRPFVHRPFFVHRRHHFRTAFVAGLAGGAALGYAPYAYSYPAAYGDDCVVMRKRIINPWGDIVIRRRLVCGY